MLDVPVERIDILSAVTEMGQDELSNEKHRSVFPRPDDQAGICGHSQNALNSAGFRARFAAVGEHPITLPL